ncbi:MULTISPECIES: hypothetical protein [unclassified Nocardioides]|uniref:hypothetical protein n=1 Tax=unclassified Nocardioides TaxID=2615069 RepID=UPI0006F31142|nr:MULTISPECIES: hypothetical protein [unclassified Nocardioides]KQY61793.1 hypothetical protein ASD30_25425 [Nocardioides sp. Root140]KQZ70778.1 hypothetical protein ASD66_14515 [Nocardioides sp. Root151]KRF10875.1 hypothetical protein ASH02_18690 [Nocardioides sp. Soil796]
MNESASFDQAAKQRVRQALEARAADHLRSFENTVRQERSAAELDQEATHSVDDLSQSDEQGELSGLLGAAEDHQQAGLARIDDLDFGPKDTVGPGAIVGFGGDRYVVGVVASAFECDGVTYEGISTDSPIYASVEGLRVGDTFNFGGREHRIDLVS